MWAVPYFSFTITTEDVYDLHHAILGIMYSVLVTAVITDSIKDAVEVIHPSNFYYRCFRMESGLLKLMGMLCVMETLELSKKDIKASLVDIPHVPSRGSVPESRGRVSSGIRKSPEISLDSRSQVGGVTSCVLSLVSWVPRSGRGKSSSPGQDKGLEIRSGLESSLSHC
ncbi:phosphatidic acid phosphatase type [Datura stramonium]|uniref:Phosphatidic acid phosphatase type n=1 Tax=Datura stramonium TaxID=4076 RepID=A0ABS8VB73_DATST|nr:phosphatidic acid phosphatase type [Datura stramonium]